MSKEQSALWTLAFINKADEGWTSSSSTAEKDLPCPWRSLIQSHLRSDGAPAGRGMLFSPFFRDFATHPQKFPPGRSYTGLRNAAPEVAIFFCGHCIIAFDWLCVFQAGKAEAFLDHRSFFNTFLELGDATCLSVAPCPAPPMPVCLDHSRHECPCDAETATEMLKHCNEELSFTTIV